MTRERWQLSGNSADFYDRYVSRLMEPWVQAVVEIAELRPGERVLDVGCGPGFVARRAAGIVGSAGRVVGLDNNESMIDKARELSSPDTDVEIEWRYGEAQDLPFDADSFDAVFAQQVLQFCSDPLTVLQEMKRVLSPGGRISLCSWQSLDKNPYPIAQVRVFERYLGIETASSLRAPYLIGSAEELTALISEAGFHDVRVLPTVKETHVGPAENYLLGHFAALPFAGAIAALSDEKRQAMTKELLSELGEYARNGELRFPSGAFLMTGRA